MDGTLSPRKDIFRLIDGKSGVALTLLIFTSLLSIGCHSAPITGRRQFLLVPQTRELEMGVAAFQQKMSEEIPSRNPQYSEMVQRVGQRLARVANRPEYQWEFRLIDSPTANAFCLPGGKVAIYEGILPICETEAGLATVMSHEVAHALARHGAERVTHGYLVNGLGTILSFALQQSEMTMATELMNGYGLASKYGFVLPYSRKHEMEADYVGLMLMAQAGYDPAEAPRFWQRFADATRGGETPEFLSTHPADERRANQLLKNLDEAVALYRSAPQQYGLGLPLSFGTGTEPRQLAENRQRAMSDVDDWARVPTASREQVAATMSALAQQRSRNRIKPIDLVSAELPIDDESNPVRKKATKQHLSESLFKDRPPVLSVPRPIEFDKPRAVRPKPMTIPEFNPLRD